MLHHIVTFWVFLKMDREALTCMKQLAANWAGITGSIIANLLPVAMVPGGVHRQGSGRGKDFVAQIALPSLG